jgi:hypothetical protein
VFGGPGNDTVILGVNSANGNISASKISEGAGLPSA